MGRLRDLAERVANYRDRGLHVECLHISQATANECRGGPEDHSIGGPVSILGIKSYVWDHDFDFISCGVPLIGQDANVTMLMCDVRAELDKALENWPSFNSAHEGYAVLKEEVDELWEQVKVNQKRRDLDKMRKEAIQIAAMAIRFVYDVCNEEKGRK